MNEGRLFVVSAPSGAGKTTLLKQVMVRVPGLSFSVSHTTRAPRPKEKSGFDYHFTSRKDFLEMIRKGLFLEHAEVHENLYGTSKLSVIEQLQQGIDIILDIDVQGAAIIRDSAIFEAAHIFIVPPGLNELESRLRGRGTEGEEDIAIRLKNAKAEMQAADDYDYLIVNDSLAEATDLLVAIIWAERARLHRFPSGKPITGIVE